MKKESKKQAARPRRGEDLKRKVCRHRNRNRKRGEDLKEKCADTENRIEKEEKTSKEKCADTEIQKRRRPHRKVCRHRK